MLNTQYVSNLVSTITDHQSSEDITSKLLLLNHYQKCIYEKCFSECGKQISVHMIDRYHNFNAQTTQLSLNFTYFVSRCTKT